MRAAIFSIAVAAPMMALASAAGFQFPDAVPLDKRQTSGPKFECHSACGNAILQSQSNSNYCDSKEWVGLLNSCLNCAQEFQIWQYYSPQVKPAAEKCGLDATPKPANGGGAASSAAAAPSSTQAAASQPAAATQASQGAATSSAALQSQSAAPDTTFSTAGSKPATASHASHGAVSTANVTPPAASQTPAQAGAGSISFNKMAAGIAAIVGLMAALH